MGKILKSVLGGIFGSPVLSTALALGNTVGSIWSQERANKLNQDINEQNLDFSREQFQYQKYLNNNQFQIQSADAQKAGINPLAMNSGSLHGGSYSNSFNPMESVYNGELGPLMAQFANIANQKEMNNKTNETNASIAEANNKNSKDIAIIKALTDKDIADNLNKTQLDKLVKSLASQEKIASFTVAEETRHNKAIEAIQDKLAESQKVLNSATATHYKKMDYINQVNSAVENYIKESRDNQLKEQLKIQQGFLREAIRDNNTKRAKVIIDGINDLLSTAVSAINPLSGLFSSGSSNKIGF